MSEEKIKDLQKQLEEKDKIIDNLVKLLERESTIDHITGLLNKNVMYKVLELEINKVERSLQSFSIIIINVPQFNAISRKFGSLLSDALLCDMALSIQSFLRKQDIIARWENDEFLIILPETNKTEARNVEESIRIEFGNYIYKKDEVQVECNIIMGVAKYNLGDSIEECILRAEKEIEERIDSRLK